MKNSTLDIRNTLNRLKFLNEEFKRDGVWYHGSQFEHIEFNEKLDKIDLNMLGYGVYLTSKREEAEYYATDENKRSGYVFEITLTTNDGILKYDQPIPEQYINKLESIKGFYDGFLDENDGIDFEDYEYYSGDGSIQISWDSLEEPLPDWAKQEGLSSGYFIFNDKINKIIKDGLSREQVEDFLSKIEVKSSYGKKFSDHAFDNPTFYVVSNKEGYVTKNNVFDSMYNLLHYLYLGKYKSLKKVSDILVSVNINGIIYNIDTSDYGYGATVCVVYNSSIFNIKSKEYVEKVS
jgi:hypothetical protein